MSTKELRKGADGEAVVRLQQQLMDYGYYRDVLDGDFGPKTEAAVKAFQAAYDLGDTGVVDAETAGALGIEDVIDSFFDDIGWGDGIQDEWPTADELVDLCLSQASTKSACGVSRIR